VKHDDVALSLRTDSQTFFVAEAATPHSTGSGRVLQKTRLCEKGTRGGLSIAQGFNAIFATYGSFIATSMSYRPLLSFQPSSFPQVPLVGPSHSHSYHLFTFVDIMASQRFFVLWYLLLAAVLGAHAADVRCGRYFNNTQCDVGDGCCSEDGYCGFTERQ
jgi:hypothetical protein